MSNNIEELRKTLFEVIAGVRDGSIDLGKARQINEISKTIVESAKVEVDFLDATGGTESKFIQPKASEALPPGITGVTVHRIA